MRKAVLLRDVVEGDLPLFFEHQRDPESVRLAAFASREREVFFAHWAKCNAASIRVLEKCSFASSLPLASSIPLVARKKEKP